MASNSDSKQKRARQNRAQREAREARTKAAAIPADERKAKYASSTATDGGAKKGSTRERPARRPRLGDTVVDPSTLEGSWFTKRMSVPGGSQVLMGLALVVIVTVMSFFVKLPAVKATKDREALPAETLLDRIGPMALVFIIGALLIGIAAAHYALSPRRRQIWTWAAVLCFSVSLVGLSWYMFPAGFFGFAVYRARKVEGPAPGSRAARALAARQEQAEQAAGDGADAAPAASDDDA